MGTVARVLSATLLLALPGTSAGASDLPAHDAFSKSQIRRELISPLRDHSSPLVKHGARVQVEPRLGVPTFLWATEEASSPARSLARWSAAPEQAARGYLADFAPFYRLTAQDAGAAVLQSVHDTGRGAIIAKFRQRVDGLEVFRTEINVVMGRDRELIALSGYLSPNAPAHLSGMASRFSLAPQAAVARVLEDMAGSSIDPRAFYEVGSLEAEYSYFDLARSLPADSRATLTQPARVKPVLYDLGDRLEAGFYVEMSAGLRDSQDSDYYAYVVSAQDGSILFRHDLTAYDQYTYRVWADSSGSYIPFDGPQGNDASPHPTGIPDGYQAPFVPSVDVTLQNSPFSRNDPWLPASATETSGNNVDAYADLFSPDGYGPVAPPATPATGDFRAQASAPGAFAYSYDTAQQPSASAEQRQAAITQLFFTTNFLHDWFYDSGFDEASGNAQAQNHGRGGLEGDSLRAEAQDYGGRNNANMATPADGARPRMQMYVWDANTTRYLDVNAPPSIAGRKVVGTATFGATDFNLTGEVVYALPNDGCAALTNAAEVAGKIALIDRGTCAFTVKAENAQAAGAVGVLIANSTTGTINMAGTSPITTVPVLSVLQSDGAAIKAELSAGNPVNVTMIREPGIDRDGTIDNAVVAHEWGHYISNRLIVNASGLGNIMGRGMGEGWADFHALLMTVKAEDATHPANTNWTGAFAAATYLAGGSASLGGNNEGYYFGIRRVPYSIDFAKNALTFQHIQNGVPLPPGVPTAFGQAGSNNAEVHNTGEVWATMLWECYASLLKDTARLTFDQARDRMRDYLVAAYKMTPANPTLVEARDALLAAAWARDPADYQLFGAAFARRGAGVGAVSPDRFSTTNVGVVESYVWGNDLQYVDATLDDSVTWCDLDGYLDNGETGRLTVQIKNIGAGTLNATTATVMASSGAVTFPNGGLIQFPPSQPFGTASAGVDVRLTGSAPLSSVVFTLSISDPSLATPRTITASIRRWVNVDDLPAVSAGDDFESNRFAWTPAGSSALSNVAPWRRLADLGGGRAHGPDPSAGSDQYLVSPQLNVSATGSFGFTFTHRFDFEADPVGAPGRAFYDGGRIELSTDGATWTDIGAMATPTYNGVLVTYAGNVNPLAGLAAYVGQNSAYPGYEPVTVDLGTAYQGQTVQVRFRVATDASAGAGGWEVDNLAFTGIDNTPFPLLVANSGACVNRRPSAQAGADQVVDERTQVTLDGSPSMDPDGDALTYAWTQTTGPVVDLSGESTATPAFTAPEVTAGGATLSFSLTVTDSAGNTSSPATTSVTVRDVNRAPLASAGAAQSANERGAATLDGTASVDPDGDLLTYAWAQTAGPTVTLSDAASPAPTFATPEVTADTVLTFDLVVSDGALSSPATVDVTVRNVNRAPVVNAGADQAVDERGSATLGAASSDPDGDSLTYAWTQIGGPSVTLSDPSAASPTFATPEVTTSTILAFVLTVSDGSLSSTALARVEVRNVNRPPVAEAGEGGNVVQGSLVTLHGAGSHDPDRSPLTYSWRQVSGPEVTLDAPTSAQPSFTAPKGLRESVDLTFELTVADEDGATGVDTVTITVGVQGGGGCGCTAGNSSTSGAILPLLLLGAFALGRRRRVA